MVIDMKRVTVSSIANQIDCNYSECLQILRELGAVPKNNRVVLDQNLIQAITQKTGKTVV